MLIKILNFCFPIFQENIHFIPTSLYSILLVPLPFRRDAPLDLASTRKLGIETEHDYRILSHQMSTVLTDDNELINRV